MPNIGIIGAGEVSNHIARVAIANDYNVVIIVEPMVGRIGASENVLQQTPPSKHLPNRARRRHSLPTTASEEH